MSTRSTVKFYQSRLNKGEKEDVIILSAYHQSDGYPEGVGQELADFLKSKKIINGIGDQTMETGYANGLGCLAAQYVREHKERIGGFYLTTPDDEQEYNYEVRYSEGKFIVSEKEIGLECAPEDYEEFLEEYKNSD